MKKVISLFVVFAMMTTTMQFAFATESTTEVISSSEILLESNTENSIVLRCEDLANGDSRFYLIENGINVHETYVNNSENIIEDINCVTEEITIHDFSQVAKSQYSMYANRPVEMGVITYNYYGGTGSIMGTCGIRCSYNREFYAGSRYNINGDYQTLASFAGFLTALFGLPGFVAGSFAQTIVTALGLGAGLGGLIIPDHYIRCDETYMQWIFADSYWDDVNTTIEGSLFELTQEGYVGDTYTDGGYWPASSYTSHNSDFAVHAYWELYSPDTVEIVSWS